MAKLRVELEPNDWQAVLNYLSAASYREVAPLIGKIAEQLKLQPSPSDGAAAPAERLQQVQ